MSSKGNFLKSIYSDAEITVILEEAINLNLQLYIFDDRNGRSFPLAIQHLVQVRKYYPHIAFVRVEEPVSTSMGGIHRISGSLYEQPVGYSDIRADEENLAKIKAMFESKQASPSLLGQLRGEADAGVVEDESIEAEQGNENEAEIEDPYWSNPADRDPRLFDDAVKLYMKKKQNIARIHEHLFRQEQGKSNISIFSLKHIVKLAAVRREANKRLLEKEKQKQKVNE